MSEMEKAYEPAKYEADIYRMWEESGAFSPSGDPNAEPFTVLMPPPNANADLHLGHTLSTTLQDIMTRFARMQGKAALFVPGADHAGFETQVVYERHLNSQGKSRFDFDRADLYQQIWEFVQSNKGNMEDQQRRIGASVDWSRNTFTLDPHVVGQAHNTFQKLWDDDLLYRGKRIVNYCTFHGTSFSDLEVEFKEVNSHLWQFRYPVMDSEESIVIATTRPETILGDTAVAVHPDDARYRHLIGKLVELPITGRQIPILADEAVDPAFGTGAVKITPAHDATDFEIGERHNLPAIEVIGKDGLMTEATPSDYRGMKPEAAREKIVADLTEKGFHVKTDDYTHVVGHCYKCGNIIQPLILDQWLIRVKSLAARAIQAVEEGKIKVVPHSKTAVLIQWYENLRDWNISRQIVWGIPIPAFIAGDGDILVDTKATEDAVERDGKTYHRDPDTFDTWFSSGQWPEVTLHYPDGEDFKRFYPTSVMETGADILFWWVSRMIMFGLYLTDEVPFKVVYLHGLITDAETGKKMSKSKGNVLAPTPLLERYGADALRMGLVANRSAGLNQGFSEKRVEAYRNFNNKLWNVARFILPQINNYNGAPSPASLTDYWIMQRFSRENVAITAAIQEYRFSEALERLYGLLWNDLADWYIEASKLAPNSSVLAWCLETILKLAHPFAPFISESIWQKLPWQSQNLIISTWPQVVEFSRENGEKADQFVDIMALVSQLRSISSELRLDKPVIGLKPAPSEETANLIKRLGRVSSLIDAPGPYTLRLTSADAEAWIEVGESDMKHYIGNLTTQQQEATAYLERLNRQLDNPRYTELAPPELVQETRDRQTQVKLLLSKLDEQLRALQ
jgi:valyl-tRNA synthetase